jgi:hypothetical protein
LQLMVLPSESYVTGSSQTPQFHKRMYVAMCVAIL